MPKRNETSLFTNARWYLFRLFYVMQDFKKYANSTISPKLMKTRSSTWSWSSQFLVYRWCKPNMVRLALMVWKNRLYRTMVHAGQKPVAIHHPWVHGSRNLKTYFSFNTSLTSSCLMCPIVLKHPKYYIVEWFVRTIYMLHINYRNQLRQYDHTKINSFSFCLLYILFYKIITIIYTLNDWYRMKSHSRIKQRSVFVSTAMISEIGQKTIWRCYYSARLDVNWFFKTYSP